LKEKVYDMLVVFIARQIFLEELKLNSNENDSSTENEESVSFVSCDWSEIWGQASSSEFIDAL